MSNTNTVADLDVRIQGLSNLPFSGMCKHNGYAYLEGSQLQSNDKSHWRGAATSNTADIGQVFQTLAIHFSVCPPTTL